MNSLYFEEEIIQQLYLKRKQLNKLQKEVDELTSQIKGSLQLNHMFYASTKNFTLYLNPKNKPTSNFIQMLENNGLENLVYKHCYKDNFILGCNKLDIPKEEYSNYQELWYYTLSINKK